MKRRNCAYTGFCEIEVDGKKKVLYSFSLQDDTRCLHANPNGEGLGIIVDDASAEDLRYIRLMINQLIDECLSKGGAQ